MILCTKSTSEKARNAAYDLLVKMGQKYISWAPDKTPQGILYMIAIAVMYSLLKSVAWAEVILISYKISWYAMHLHGVCFLWLVSSEEFTLLSRWNKENIWLFYFFLISRCNWCINLDRLCCFYGIFVVISEMVQKYFELFLTGLRVNDPHVVSCTVLALARVLFHFKGSVFSKTLISM